MLRRLLALATALTIASAAPAAHAASGSMSDPSGDLPDIIKLTYANKADRVVMAVTYEGYRAQNESFYMRWGRNASKSYQVFVSQASGLQELRLNGSKVACRSLKVSHNPDTLVTRTVVPRSCLSKAPNKLRFQAIATEGLYSADETKLSAGVAHG